MKHINPISSGTSARKPMASLIFILTLIFYIWLITSEINKTKAIKLMDDIVEQWDINKHVK